MLSCLSFELHEHPVNCKDSVIKYSDRHFKMPVIQEHMKTIWYGIVIQDHLASLKIYITLTDLYLYSVSAISSTRISVLAN